MTAIDTRPFAELYTLTQQVVELLGEEEIQEAMEAAAQAEDLAHEVLLYTQTLSAMGLHVPYTWKQHLNLKGVKQ